MDWQNYHLTESWLCVVWVCVKFVYKSTNWNEAFRLSDLLRKKSKNPKTKKSNDISANESQTVSVRSTGAVQSSSTIRLMRETHVKVKVLVALGYAKTADGLIDRALTKYIENNLTPDELSQMDMLMKLHAARSKR